MWNTPTDERLNKIPRLYETEGIELKNKKIYLHFFMAGCDWYIAEYDGQDLFFGYAILNGDMLNAEWGYISFSELKNLRIGFMEVECEEFWQVKAASQIDKIRHIT